MSTADPNRVIVTGENPFIRLSETDGGPNTTEASYWRVFLSPEGTGHVLYLKSGELTEKRWRIYSDNLKLTRWLQKTVQGMLNAELKDEAIPVIDATFAKSGDPNESWTETISADGDEIALTWHEMGDPLLIHTQPGAGGRAYGLSTVLIPSGRATITRNGVSASGHAWPRDREGRKFSTCALAFAESWTEPR